MYQRALTADIKKRAADLTKLESLMTASTKVLNDLTYENGPTLINIQLKNNDDLMEGLRKASRSCCEPAVNELNEDDRKYVFNEASKLTNEVRAIASALIKADKIGVIQNYSLSFSKLVLTLKGRALTIENCLAERSPKDGTVKIRVFMEELSNIFYLNALRRIYSRFGTQ